MQSTKIEINSLMTVKNYATRENITSSYIYKLIKEKKLAAIDIDGVKFIDIKQYPTFKK